MSSSDRPTELTSRTNVFLRGALCTGLLALSACAGVQRATAPDASVIDEVPGEVPSAPAPDAIRFNVMPAQSTLRILTYRAGPMARFGHNHVIAARSFSGTVWLADPIAQSFVELNIPVSEFVVDNDEDRATLGEGFEKPVPDSARAGTRDNMLSSDLLNAEQYPFVRVRCGQLQQLGAGTLNCAVSVAGSDVSLAIPVTVAIDEYVLTATGKATLTHEQLGLTPFSAAGGAISVADGMTLAFDLVAQQLSGQTARRQ
ncbi:MAG: YceI family protein [Pseudomonadota bacterium]